MTGSEKSELKEEEVAEDESVLVDMLLFSFCLDVCTVQVPPSDADEERI